MNRKRKLVFNTITGVAKQVVAVVCGFILPRYMLMCYGSAVNGLVTSITHFLSFITLMDMGVGAVIQSNLYRPLAEKDINSISQIVVASKKFFRVIAYILLVYVVGLCIFLPNSFSDSFDQIFSASLIVVVALSTFAQYFFGITYELLLNSDQKSYIQLSMQIITILLNTGLSIILMKLGTSIHIVKLVTSLVYILRPIAQSIYVKNHYKIDSKVKIEGEPIKQKWNGFSQHLASVICGNIDVVVLTLFSTLENVSIYSVYYLVTSGVTQIIMTAATGLESMFGNMIAKKEENTLVRTFETIEWVVHTLVTGVFTVATIMIVPFVSIYTEGITDANYIAPVFGMLLVIAYATQCLRIPYFRIIKAAGHYKQTQNGSFISAGLNIIISLSLVFQYGLIGIAIGTFVAMLYHTIYFVVYLNKSILYRPIRFFFKHLFVDLIIGSGVFLISRVLPIKCMNYIEWVQWSVIITLITVVISVLVNLAFYGKIIKWSVMRR